MKKVSKILIFLFLTTFTFSSCDDFLNVDSERLLNADEYQMNAANDTLYSMFGVFSQLQKLTDSYVLLGELRADLVDVNENASVYLKEINNFDFSSKNPYTNNIKDYYAVINNCNFIIHTIDTTKLKGGLPVMKKVYAATKAIRAWTYMQMALNYGTVIYYDKPILSIDQAEQTYTTFNSIEELAPALIADLLPWKDTDKPSLGSFSSISSKDAYFPIRFLLGDLYLWLGQYENAATEYRDLMYKSQYIVSPTFRSSLEVVNNAFTGNYSINPNWGNLFDYSSAESITYIAVSNENSEFSELDSLYLNKMIKPSDIAINNWNNQQYFHSAILDTLGDQRKLYSVGTLEKSTSSSTGYYLWMDNARETSDAIYKYALINPLNYTIKQVLPYRVALLYLRYAEALNRLGKPNAAFAVLKNGLNRISLTNRKIIPRSELLRKITESKIKSKINPLVDSVKFDTTYVAPSYMNFGEARFDNNIGIRMRGCGNVNLDTTNYIIPKLNNLYDSILFVEDKIQQELALERAFEGNRFHDLMRIAIRRNDNMYLADKIAAKHTNNKEAIKSKLTNRSNWYLKK